MKFVENKINIKFALNMGTILMVKPDKLLVTKTGHFYLFVTGLDIFLDVFQNW